MVPEARKRCGHPGRCGLLRERSRLARLRPVDAIRRGASSGAHALWSSGSESNSPPSCGVLDEAGPGHGLGKPFAVSKGTREIHAATCGSGGWPGPHYFFAVIPHAAKKSTTEGTEFHRGTTKVRTATAFLCGFAPCFSVLSVVRLLKLPVAPPE